MDLNQCAEALTNQHCAIAAGQSQLESTLSKDHLNTVMGPAFGLAQVKKRLLRALRTTQH